MKKIVGVDIDGVLANFIEAYSARLAQAHGSDLIPPGEQPTQWFFAEEYGYSEAEDEQAWGTILADPQFWEGLRAYPDTERFLGSLRPGLRASALTEDDEVYFLTVRPGLVSKAQTERWLRAHGFPEPTVLIARGDKGSLARGLELTHFLDDRPANCFSVRDGSPKTQVTMLAKPYNAWCRRECRDRKIRVVESPLEFSASLLG